MRTRIWIPWQTTDVRALEEALADVAAEAAEAARDHMRWGRLLRAIPTFRQAMEAGAEVGDELAEALQYAGRWAEALAVAAHTTTRDPRLRQSEILLYAASETEPGAWHRACQHLWLPEGGSARDWLCGLRALVFDDPAGCVRHFQAGLAKPTFDWWSHCSMALVVVQEALGQGDVDAYQRASAQYLALLGQGPHEHPGRVKVDRLLIFLLAERLLGHSPAVGELDRVLAEQDDLLGRGMLELPTERTVLREVRLALRVRAQGLAPPWSRLLRALEGDEDGCLVKRLGSLPQQRALVRRASAWS